MRTLNFDPDLNAWSINFERTIGRKNEEVRWNGYARNQTVSAMAAAGLVTGLDEVRQEFGLDVKPYFAGARPLSPPSAPPPPTPAISARTSSTTSPLICARTSPSTPNFAETEVDDRQVNLTRFPLRFPEKREFFLQGINEYNFSGDGNAFFSRRIGLNDGAVQPVDVGSKLNGQLGAFEVAALHVRNAALDRSVAEDGTGGPLPGEDFIVLRSRRLFFSQSHLGVLYTRRSERGTDADPLHMIGVDSPVNWSSCRRIGVKPRT